MLRNYLNYAGSKDRYYPEIRKHLAKAERKHMIDMFTGGGSVAFNSLDLFDGNIYAYDKNEDLIKIHKWVQTHAVEEVLTDIYTIINMYELSKTNKDGFLKLRADYNNQVRNGVKSIPMLYCLVMHSFNYSLHTNNKGEFNAPSGATRSYFNNETRKKIMQYKAELDKYSENKLVYEVKDILNDESYPVPINETVFFVDPPYSAALSKHPYRVAGIKWDESADRKLLDILSNINDKQGKFVFTNVLENNGVSNIPLRKWVENNNFLMYPVNVDYTNSSYQRKNYGTTKEVIITNFQE